MSSRAASQAVLAVLVACLLATAVVLVVGLGARLANGNVWPAMLIDWSMGSALLAISAAAVGAIVIRRLPGNVVGWLFLATGLGTALVFGLREIAEMVLRTQGETALGLWGAWLFTAIIPLNMTVLGLLAVLFPYGSPPSPRWRWLVVVLVVLGGSATAATMISPYSADQSQFAGLRNPAALLSPELGGALVEATTLGIIAGWLVCGMGLAHRLRRARGTERAQVKWFVFAVSCAFLTFFPGFWIEPLFVFSTLIGFPAIPIAAAVAILRHRLYDIDRLINRTIVYAVVSGVLALAYLAAVTTIRAVTAPLTGDTAVAVAASTLAVAAMFRPVRNRVQGAVDRRFNRARYDAITTAAAYRSRLRDQLDLDAIGADLVATARTALQPRTAALWLRTGGDA